MEAPFQNSLFFSVGIVNHHIFTQHKTGMQHVESPKRVDSIINRLKNENALTNTNSITPRRATSKELKLAHSIDYIKLVEKECSECARDEVRQLSTGDVQICRESYKVATYAAGGVLNAIDAVMSCKFPSVFCVVRPPGHHACKDVGMGFCLFNNVAIGAFYLLENYPINRVLIVDWDLHHGNGTEELVKYDKRIFYFSTHQSPLWPGTGHANEKGCGNINNVEVMAGATSRDVILETYASTLTKEMESFKPEFILISAGFDAHHSDPLGQLNLLAKDFETLTLLVRKIADKYAQGRIVSALEGGYNLEGLADSAFAHVKGLAQKI